MERTEDTYRSTINEERKCEMSEGKMPNRKCTGANCPMQVGYVVPETCPEPEKCRYATFPQTNADRVRNMTDEELVDVIHCPLVEVDGCHTGKSCALCILRWLRSPVEESEK